MDLDTATATVVRSLQRLRGEVDEDTGRRRGRLAEVDPKTEDSTVPRPLVAVLDRHRQTQQAQRRRAPVWVDPGLVFTTACGAPLEPRNVNRAWDALCGWAGVRPLRLHDLRHSAASFPLLQGVDLKVVQATLRHSRLATTADLYTHVLAEVQHAAADRMGDFLTTWTELDRCLVVRIRSSLTVRLGG